MKWSRILLISLAVLLAVIVLVWFLPARWAVGMLQSRLHGLQLEQVGGSLWQGHADRVVAADGSELGRAQWTLSRRALLGDIRLELDLQQPQLHFHGYMQRVSDSEIDWHDVQLHVDAAWLDQQPLLRGNRPRGTLDIQMAQAQLQGNWPMQLDAKAQWHDAALQTPHGWLSLGQLNLQAASRSGVLQATMGDDGSGPLQVAGQLTLSPLGWRYTVTLEPRRDDPLLRRWLAGLGKPDSDGTVRLQGHGGLISPTSSSPTSSTEQ